MSLRILFVSSEAVPYAKSGGLGEAVSALAWTLARKGHEVKILIPRYYFINPFKLEMVKGVVPGPEQRSAWLYTPGQRGAEDEPAPQFLFLDFEDYFGRDGIYGIREDPEFGDNPARFAFLSRSAVLLGEAIEWYPDVIHIHDWPASLVPLYRDLLEPPQRFAVVLSVHNGGYQGEFDAGWVDSLRIPRIQAERHGLYHYDRINFLKSAVVSSDAVTTVSPTYAAELEAEETGGGLAPLYRARREDFTGVINGIDYSMWDPSKDPHLPVHFDESTLDRKEELKGSLQAELGLAVDRRPALIGMVTRLAGQKGIRELFEDGYGCIEQILEQLPLQFAILASGEPWCETAIRMLSEQYANFRAVVGFDDGLAHRMEAGSDFFLMPSKYEPCGLNQMYSLRYGTVPIVTRTGGLADTVEQIDRSSDTGTGFFIPYATPWDIFTTVNEAVSLYQNDKAALKRARARGMKKRFTWDSSADKYIQVYRSALRKRERTAG